MPTEEKKLIFKLEAQNAKYLRKIEQMEKRQKRFVNNTKKDFGSIEKAFAGIGVTLTLRSFIRATEEQERASAQLKQTLLSTNNAVGKSFEELAGKAAELQKNSTFGDEEILVAMSQLATFTKITGDEFDRTTELALDLSTKMGQDLRSSVLQLGKALNDPVANLGALGRAGIQFDKEQQALIKTLFKSGKTAEAQSLILEELQTQFGGSAKAARDTFGGALDALGNAAGDLLEANSLGGATEKINELTDLLQDPKTVQAAQTLANAIIDLFGKAASVIANTVNLTKFLSEQFAAFVGGVAADDVLGQEDKLQNLIDKRSELLKQSASIEQLSGAPDQSLQKNIASLDLQIEKQREYIEALYETVGAANHAKAAKLENLSDTGTSASVPDVGEGLTGKAPEDYEKELAQFQQTLEGLKGPLTLYNDKVAMANTLLAAGKISQEDYNFAVTNYALAVNAATGANQQYHDDLAKADELTQMAKTSLAVMVEEIQTSQRLLDKGLITQETIDANKQRFESLGEQTKKTTEQMSVYADQAARNMQDALADFLFDPAEEGFKGLLNNFVDILRRMAAEAAAAKIFEGLSNIGSGSSSSSSNNVDYAGLISSFVGLFDSGGTIPAGKFGIVGEKGPELVEGPAAVTSRADTKKMFSGGSKRPLRIINVPNEAALNDYVNSGAMDETLINRFEQNSRRIRQVISDA